MQVILGGHLIVVFEH